MKKTKKTLALLLSLVLVLSVGLITATAADYDLQGTGGNQLKMVTPSDITDNTAEEDTYFSNTINTELDPTADIVFTFSMTSGMNNFDETLFTETNLPQIGVYDTYGGTKLADPAFGEKTDDGISIVIPADTLTDGTYALVFGMDIQGNNADKTLGMDIVFTFTAKTGAAADTDPADTTDAEETDDADNATEASAFTDVPDWAKEYVDAVVANGCMTGTDETTFNPNGTVTRGEFVTILGMARGIETDKYTDSAFDDILAADDCSPYAAWAVSKEITNGYGDVFGPDDVLTREQAITMLYRYAVVFSMDTAAEGDVSAFSDSDQMSTWAATAMAWAVGGDYIGGMDDGTLSPDGAMTRAQIAKLIAVLVLEA